MNPRLAAWPPFRALGTLGAALAVTAALANVAAQDNAGSISGLVVSAATNRPIANATISLFEERSDAGRGSGTDANGRFESRPLPPGRYRLSAEARGYLRAEFGAEPGLGATLVTVSAGQQQTGLVIRLHRGGSISGMVLDERRDPVVNVGVRAFLRRFVDGAPQFQPVAAADTDDRGAFRIFALEPGQYVVAATNPTRPGRGAVTPPASDEAAVTTFAPATTDAVKATVFALGVDQQRAGVTIQMSRERGATIDGRVSGPGAAGTPGLAVQLVADSVLVRVPPMSARPEPGGRFTFLNVAPGRYSLVVRPNGESGIPRTWGATPVVVSAGATVPASLVLNDGARIAGTIVAEDGRAKTPWNVGLRPLAGSHPSAAWAGAASSADGAFVIGNVAPGAYAWTGPPNFSLSTMVLSIAVGGKDVSDVPLVVAPGAVIEGMKVTVVERTGAVVGTVIDASGRPTTAGAVLVFSTSAKDWTPASRRLRDTRPDTSGRYEVRGLPAGEYFVAPVARVEPGQVFDPSFLQANPGAVRVNVRPAETKTADVRLPPKFQEPASKQGPRR